MNAYSSPLLRTCRLIALATAFGQVLGACSTTKRTHPYETETFISETPFQYYSSKGPALACEIGKRVLLSQGYQIDEEKPRSIRGEKYFRPKPDEATRLAITLVCLPSSLGTVIYANGLERQFEMKAKESRAGLSVAAIGSVSLPWAIERIPCSKLVMKRSPRRIFISGYLS